MESSYRYCTIAMIRLLILSTRWSFRSFPIELNIEEMSEDEDPDARQKRIESLASSIEIPDIRKK